MWHPSIQNALKTGCVLEEIKLRAASSDSRTGTLFSCCFDDTSSIDA
jgi:hypothetical protein